MSEIWSWRELAEKAETALAAERKARHESDEIAANALLQLAAANRGLECYKIQLEKDYNESDTQTIIRLSVELAAAQAKLATIPICACGDSFTAEALCHNCVTGMGK